MTMQQRLQTVKTEVSKETVLKQLLPQQSFSVKLTVIFIHFTPLNGRKYSFTHRTYSDAGWVVAPPVFCVCGSRAGPHWSSN